MSPRLTRPDEMRAAGCGRSCMIASAVIDLPEPDSPAMHSVSPRFSVKERSETTSRSPSSPRTETLSPATSSTGLSAEVGSGTIAPDLLACCRHSKTQRGK